MKRFFSLQHTSAKTLLLLLTAAILVTGSWTYLNAGAPSPLFHERPTHKAAPSLQVVNYAPLVKQVKPSVFNLRVTGKSAVLQTKGPFPMRPNQPGPFRFFFEQGVPIRPLPMRSSGSGFLINAEGYALTNQHVIRGAKTITAQLEDGREYPVKVLGQSKLLDLALLRLQVGNKDKLPYAYMGHSSKLQVGEPVIAIGNARGMGLTVTSGIVSAKGRVIGSGAYDNYIQTDAAINHGNSGGPLFNLRGEVIGINTAILRRGRGIGFAIPIDMVRRVLPQLRKKGRIDRAQLGVLVQKMTPAIARSLGLTHRHGALVSKVVAGSPADKAGIQPGDILLAVDQTKVRNHQHLPLLIAFRDPSKKVAITLLRNKKKRTLQVGLQRWSEKPAPAEIIDSGDDSGDDNGPSLDRLGVKVGPLSPTMRKKVQLPANTPGVLIRHVQRGSLAAQHGLRAGDVLVAFNSIPVRSGKHLEALIKRTPAHQTVLFRLQRKDAALFLAFPLQ